MAEKIVRYKIPDYILGLEGTKENDTIYCDPSEFCPVVVFINTRSGGQLGSVLLASYRVVLGNNQVFDLHTTPPQKVLQKIYENLEKLKGDKLADEVARKLRLIVAGGDGTASWMLSVICDLKLPNPPPIATVPLGTGNNLPFSFGWGKKNPGTDASAVRSFLQQVMDAKEMKIDNWHIIMRMKTAATGLISLPEVPNSLHRFNDVSSGESMNEEGEHTYRGGFWNYFSIGVDAQVSYEFHSERKKHPEKFKNQLLNQRTYLKLGFSSALQCSSSCINDLAKIEVMKKPRGKWVRKEIPPRIKSVICLNLPSFSGGYNPWGIPSKRDKEFTPVFVDDGLIEVVGFQSALQGLSLLSTKGHGTRLAQAHKVRFTFSKCSPSCTYMRMDGEPWKQPLPEKEEDSIVLEISHHGQVNMLARDNCISKSRQPYVENATTSTTPINDYYTLDDESEEVRKFGAADTFKLPEDIDIGSLS